MKNTYFTSTDVEVKNRSFLMGDSIQVSFFIRNSQIVLAEDCYFFLMASMRKMRMNIPLSYTLEFFQNLLTEKIIEGEKVENAIVRFVVYRNSDITDLAKASVSYFFDYSIFDDILTVQGSQELDLIKEINVNNNLLSNIKTHCPENIYAEIYALENDLDDVILLNPNKRIARSIYGNLLFLEGNIVKVVKQAEGAYISPLLESFVTFMHKNNLAELQESEIIAFETQKAEEILLISDEKGIFSVSKIRNKSFANTRFAEMINQWKQSF